MVQFLLDTASTVGRSMAYIRLWVGYTLYCVEGYNLFQLDILFILVLHALSMQFLAYVQFSILMF